MILVDTSVWVDHLRAADGTLADLLDRGLVLGHPWVAGELALGGLRQREVVLGLLAGLPRAVVATAAEVARFIESHRLYGLGIGYVDVQLLAATRLTADALLWTRDRRLAVAAGRLEVAAAFPAESPCGA